MTVPVSTKVKKGFIASALELDYMLNERGDEFIIGVINAGIVLKPIIDI